MALKVGIYIILWYGTAILAITTSKLSMQMAPIPFCLCLMQCLTATFISGVVRLFTEVPRGIGEESSILWKTSVTYTFGFIFTNLGFSIATAPFVETVKSSEPISTVLLAFFLLGEVDAVQTYACLIPIVVGVAMASLGDMTMTLAGFLIVQGSNLGFSARAVYAKQLKRTNPESGSAKNDVELFYNISRRGLFLLVPFALMDSNAVIAYFALDSFDPLRLISTMLMNGIFYTSYNLFSFMVLSEVSTSTHAVLNVFRRVVIISVTTMFFGIKTTAFNQCGVVLALLGVLCFTHSKARYSKGKEPTSPDAKSMAGHSPKLQFHMVNKRSGRIRELEVC
eukprot:gnl/MRDRNA2_/MRDRNA2_99222_c0_seq1.p1 gnl/MRDRNA2_/MRDRNA2_99222_c0~~gnl/MRDRNA2_/MRDRNA2_99222_c0_seq1.p1  ORF type:complete len:338 (+),score=41.52 gnl/MRDRNA2_/MRDRNA2_99222_c0_seq1:120-1133(+)